MLFVLMSLGLTGQSSENGIAIMQTMRKVTEGRLQPATIQVLRAVRQQLDDLKGKVGIQKTPAYLSELGSSRVMLGGYAVHLIGSSGCTLPAANNVFGFDVADLCHQVTYPSPFTTSGFDDSGRMLSVYCGDWIGDRWLVFTTITQSGLVSLGYWMTFDPVTRDANIIGQANGAMQCQDMAYDVTTAKIFGIGLDQELYRFNTTDTEARLIGIVRKDGEPFDGRFMALACNSEGILYAINEDKNLYRIDKSTGAAVSVGSLKLDNRTISRDNLQSATFDRRTGILYFALRGTAYHELYTVDTTTGRATLVGNMYVETAGLFHQYYTGPAVPPEMVTDFKASTGDDPLKIRLSWKNPECNFNGAPLTDLDSIYIYRGLSGYSLSLYDRIKAGESGREMSYDVSEKTTGTYYYGCMAVTRSGKTGLLAGGAAYCFDSKIPFQAGFEKRDNYLPLSIPAGWRVDSLNAKYFHSGAGAAVTIASTGNKLLVNALKAQKGATYELSFWGLAPSVSGARFTVDIGNRSNFSTSTLTRRTTPFTQFTVTGVARDDVLPVGLKCTTAGVYLDDVSVKMLYPGTTPDSVKSPEVRIAAQGVLEAEVSWINPVSDAGGNALKALTGVIIQKTATGGAFTTGVTADTVATTEPGKAVRATIRIPAAGNYYFRLIPVNNDGPSPYLYDLGKIGFIGNDTVATAPAGLRAEALSGGKVHLKWEEVTLGRYGGYLNGTITGYEVRVTTYDTKVLYNDTLAAAGTEFTTDALPAGVYTVGIRAIRNGNRKNAGMEALAYVTAGTGPNQTLAGGEFMQKPGANAHPFYLNYGNKSAVSQSLFTADELGGKGVIDTLSFYLYTPCTKTPFRQELKIYLGYSREGEFANTSDWKSIGGEDSRLVFSDSVDIPLYRQVIRIPVDPFYYDGRGNLLLTVIKKDLVAPPDLYSCTWIGTNCDSNRGLFKRTTSATGDSGELSSEALGAGELLKFTPAFLLNRMTGLATVKGTVTDKETGKPVENVKISFVPEEGQDRVVTTSIRNDSVSGTYDFAFLPAGRYTVAMTKVGYKESSAEVTVEPSGKSVLNVVLEPSTRITVKGKVINLKNTGVPGVAVQAEGVAGYETVTQSDGTFSIPEMLSGNSYAMHFEKEGYKRTAHTWNLGAKDSTFAPVAIPYIAYPVSDLSVETTREHATIRIGKPAVLTEAGWATDTIAKKVGGSREEMIAAIEFYPSDIRNFGLGGKELMIVRFYANDPTADYVVHLYQDEGATLVYSQEVGNSLKGWQEVLLNTRYAVDPQQEFSIAVEALAGYTGAPFALDLGPKTFKGDKVWYDGAWTRISKLIPAYDSNWQIRGVFGRELSEEAAGGYQIYRLADTDAGSPEQWTKITGASVPSVAEGYRDYTWGTVDKGVYKYAVKADWKDGNFSDFTFSNPVYKDMDSRVKVTVNLNGGSKKGTSVVLTNRDGLASHVYRQVVQENGVADFPSVRNGSYRLEINLTGYSPILKEVTVEGDATIEGDLMKEYISNPQILSAVADQDSVRMHWNMKFPGNWLDDFESYENFAISGYGDYVLDGQEEKYTMTGSVWENNKVPQSFIVFNPSAATPPVQSYKYTPRSGKKELAAFVSVFSPNRDFIARAVSQGNGIFSFHAKGIGYQGVSEKFDVLYSPAGSETSDFVMLSDSTMEAPAEWTKFSYPVPGDARYVAVRCVSPDLQVFLIDDFEYIAVNEGTPLAYEIYLDGVRIEGSLPAARTSYLFEGLSDGKHVLGLKALFATGSSGLVTTEVVIRASGIETVSGTEVRLYPNPSDNGIFYLVSSGTYQVEVYSCDGTLVERALLADGTACLDLSARPKGCYLVRLSGEDETLTLKAFR